MGVAEVLILLVAPVCLIVFAPRCHWGAAATATVITGIAAVMYMKASAGA